MTYEIELSLERSTRREISEEKIMMIFSEFVACLSPPLSMIKIKEIDFIFTK
jgi:hypothetical protein